MVRRAFTLIELIFAIVVMSIVMLSFPIIMQVDSDAREQSFAQEAALAASAKMAQLFTFQWDEASLDWNDLAENIQTVARVLDDTNTSTNAFNRIVGTELRPSGGHRHFFSIGTNATAIGDNNASVTALDDQTLNFAAASGFDTNITSPYVADSFGYKRDYQMDVKIRRVNDARRPDGTPVDYTQINLTGANRFIFTQGDVGGQTNLRAMVVTIRDDDGNITTLYGYTANIGEYAAYSRVKP